MNRTFEEWSKVKASAVTAGSVAQATNVLQMALDDIAELQRLLRDPNAVHINMLRGDIAVPSEAQMSHIRGDKSGRVRDDPR